MSEERCVSIPTVNLCCEKEIFSTGVLIRSNDTVTAVINVVNLDFYDSHNITIEVLNWSNYSNPIPVPVKIGSTVLTGPYSLPPKNLAVAIADLVTSTTKILLYEIRITHIKDKNIIVNCFGRSITPGVNQEGNTVLQSDLIKVDLISS